MNFAGYIRVSTDGQVDGFGKDVQRSAIEEWAERYDHTITHWYEDDGVSGTVDALSRPALSDLLAHTDEFDGVVALDSTRYARQFIVQESLYGLLWQQGLAVHCVHGGEITDTDDPTRTLIRQILGILAEFERSQIIFRMKNGKVQKRSKGKYIGGQVAYGTDIDGKGRSAEFVPNSTEHQVLRMMLTLRSAGCTFQQIADTLNDQNVPSKNNRRWHATSVRRSILNYERQSDEA